MVMRDPTEWQMRKGKIDVLLEEAGWDPKDRKTKTDPFAEFATPLTFRVISVMGEFAELATVSNSLADLAILGFAIGRGIP